ncbi:MAG: Crp/Fnr family transcriptional regulator [Flavobacteriales bacterium]|nr:Crp/Fnr family transcriptional regulator [Flavobacteriales bacterium]
MPYLNEPAAARLNDLIKAHCAPEWKQLLRERNTALTFRKGETIFSTGDHAERMLMIQQGAVKVTAPDGIGGERILRFAGPGEVLGHRSLGHEPVYTATATALSACTVNSIPMGLFLSTLKANGVFCYHFLLGFAAEMRRLESHMHDLMTMDVGQRVAKVLILDLETYGYDTEDKTKLAFTLSRKDIANAAATTYESVIRTLATLHRRRIIGLVGKEIRIRNEAALRKIVGG